MTWDARRMHPHEQKLVHDVVNGFTWPAVLSAERYLENREERPTREFYLWALEMPVQLLSRAAERHPDLPNDLLNQRLSQGSLHAWLNPSADLELLSPPCHDAEGWPGYTMWGKVAVDIVGSLWKGADLGKNEARREVLVECLKRCTRSLWAGASGEDGLRRMVAVLGTLTEAMRLRAHRENQAAGLPLVEDPRWAQERRMRAAITQVLRKCISTTTREDSAIIRAALVLHDQALAQYAAPLWEYYPGVVSALEDFLQEYGPPLDSPRLNPHFAALYLDKALLEEAELADALEAALRPPKDAEGVPEDVAGWLREEIPDPLAVPPDLWHAHPLD